MISALLLALLALPASAAKPAAASVQPRFSKIMIVIFENTDYEHALRRPFFSKLAHEGALLTGYYAISHPSQPNYIALVAGSTLGVDSDRNRDLDDLNLADRLDAAGKTWKIYAEGYPGNCFLKSRSGNYARKHVPFLSFTDITQDPARCARIVNAAQLASDLKNGTLPDYSLYIPDLDNDGHDTGVDFADKWYEGAFGPLVSNPKLMNGLLLATTFDEDEDGGDSPGEQNHIYASLYGASVLPGAVSANRYDHYSLLRLVEDGLGLRSLGREDASAKPIDGVWQDAAGKAKVRN